MEFYSFLAVLLSLVALGACDGSPTRLGSGSYTDTLLNGMRRLRNKPLRQTAVVRTVVPNNAFDECNVLCPIGTVCSLEFGVKRCVAAPSVAVIGSPNYGEAVVPLANDYSAPIRTGLSGATGAGSREVLGNSGLNYGDNFGFSNCGAVPTECRVNQFKRRSFNDVVKFTYDYESNRCIQVTVCASCAFVNAAQDNLFDSLFDCSRSCQQ